VTLAQAELAKLHLIRSLFADITGTDPYLLQQVKGAIEAALVDEEQATSREFTEAALRLLREHFQPNPSHGFAHWQPPDGDGRFDPLWARQELISVFKKLARFPSSTVVITGLRVSVCPPGQRWTARRQAEYEEAVAFIQSLAASWSTSSADMTLLFF
jgi:hypothetical protein